MNAIILAGAFAGALTIFLSANPDKVAAARAEASHAEASQTETDVGSMTRDIKVNPKTGEEEETSVIAFLDE